MLSFGDWRVWICHDAFKAVFLDRAKTAGIIKTFPMDYCITYRGDIAGLHNKLNARTSCELLCVVRWGWAGPTAPKISICTQVLRNNRSHRKGGCDREGGLEGRGGRVWQRAMQPPCPRRSGMALSSW